MTFTCMFICYHTISSSFRETYLLDHLGDHEGTLLIKDFRQNLQTRQDLIHLPKTEITMFEEKLSKSCLFSCVHGAAQLTTDDYWPHASLAFHLIFFPAVFKCATCVTVAKTGRWGYRQLCTHRKQILVNILYQCSDKQIQMNSCVSMHALWITGR